MFQMQQYFTLVMIISGIAYLIYWYLYFKQIRANAIKLSEEIIKFILLVPFWLVFTFQILQITFPELENLWTKKVVNQKISFKNKSRDKKSYYFIGKNIVDKEWEAAYPLRNFHNRNRVLFTPLERADVYFKGNKYSQIIMVSSNEKKKIADTMLFAKAFEIPDARISVYDDEFSDSILKKVKTDNSEIYKNIILILIALAGVWYQLLMINIQRNQYIFAGFATIFSLYCLYLLINYIQTLLGMYIPFY